VQVLLRLLHSFLYWQFIYGRILNIRIKSCRPYQICEFKHRLSQTYKLQKI